MTQRTYDSVTNQHAVERFKIKEEIRDRINIILKERVKSSQESDEKIMKIG